MGRGTLCLALRAGLGEGDGLIESVLPDQCRNLGFGRALAARVLHDRGVILLDGVLRLLLGVVDVAQADPARRELRVHLDSLRERLVRRAHVALRRVRAPYEGVGRGVLRHQSNRCSTGLDRVVTTAECELCAAYQDVVLRRLLQRLREPAQLGERFARTPRLEETAGEPEMEHFVVRVLQDGRLELDHRVVGPLHAKERKPEPVPHSWSVWHHLANRRQQGHRILEATRLDIELTGDRGHTRRPGLARQRLDFLDRVLELSLSRIHRAQRDANRCVRRIIGFRLIQKAARFVRTILPSQHVGKPERGRRVLRILRERGAIGLLRFPEPIESGQNVAAYRVKLGRRLTRGDRLVDRGQRIVSLPFRIECRSTQIHRGHVRRVLLRDEDCLPEYVLPPFHLAVGSSDIEVHLEVLRINLERTAQFPHRVHVPALCRIRATDEMERGCEFRIDLQRVLHLDDGLVVLILGVVGLGLLEVPLLGDRRILGAPPDEQRQAA